MPLEIEMLPQIRPRSVDIREPVLARQSPRTVQASRFLKYLGVRGKRSDRAADEARRLRVNETVTLCLGIIRSRFFPVRLGYAKRFEDGFRTHEAGRDGHRRD